MYTCLPDVNSSGLQGSLMVRRKKEDEVTTNKLCARCRRTCKQPDFAVVSSCPRYYPIRKKQMAVKEWKQQELFPVEPAKKRKRTSN